MQKVSKVDKVDKESKPELKNILGGALKTRNLTTQKVLSDIESKKAVKYNCLDKKGNILSTVLLRYTEFKFSDYDKPLSLKLNGLSCAVIDDNGFICFDAYNKGNVNSAGLYINSVYVPSDTVELKTA
jgi:hypothetical protein